MQEYYIVRQNTKKTLWNLSLKQNLVLFISLLSLSIFAELLPNCFKKFFVRPKLFTLILIVLRSICFYASDESEIILKRNDKIIWGTSIN